jgi:hypothetical protein
MIRCFVRPPEGPVAQLGARVNGIHEVAGSIPARSTNTQLIVNRILIVFRVFGRLGTL